MDRTDENGTVRREYLPVAACLVALLCVGVVYIWSVFKADAIAFFGWGDGASNLVASFMLFAFCFGGFFGSMLAKKIGAKKVIIFGIVLFAAGTFAASFLPAGSSIVWFYLLYCIMGGAGCGFAYNAGLFTLQKWLPDKIGLASGLGTSFFGLGSVVFVPVINALLGSMNISMTLRLMACGVFVIGGSACVFIREPKQKYILYFAAKAQGKKMQNNAPVRDIPLKEAIHTLPFWCIAFSTFAYNATWNMLTPLVKGLGIERGLSVPAAVLCVSLTGIFNAGGRLINSMLSDKFGRIRTLYFVSAVTTACALLLTFIGGGGFFAVTLMTVFAFGGPAAIVPALCSDIFGPKQAGINYGLIMTSLGISSIVFNAISNALYAATGTYVATFIIGAVFAVLTIVSYALVNARMKRM